MLLNPLESRYVAALADHGDGFQVRDVVLADVFPLRILLSDGSDGRGRGVQVVNCIV